MRDEDKAHCEFMCMCSHLYEGIECDTEFLEGKIMNIIKL